MLSHEVYYIEVMVIPGCSPIKLTHERTKIDDDSIIIYRKLSCLASL